MRHYMPAAAIPEGSEVILPVEVPFSGGDAFEVFHVINSSPRPGKITWSDPNGREVVIGGAHQVEIVSLP